MLFIAGLYFSFIFKISYDHALLLLEETASVVSKSFPSDKPNLINAYCQSLSGNEVRVTILNHDGTLLGDSSEDIRIMEDHRNRPEIYRAFIGQIGIERRYSKTLQQEMLYYSLPVMESEKVAYVIRTSVAIDFIDTIVFAIIIQLLFILLFTILMGGLMSFLMTRRFNKPLSNIMEAAKEFSLGNLEYRLFVEKPAELKNLAIAMNKMADELKEKINLLISQRNQWRAIFSSLSEPVLIMDQRLVIRELNDAALALFGLNLSGARGRPLLEICRNSDLRLFCDQLINSENKVIESEIKFYRLNTSYFLVRGMCVTLDHKDPVVILVLNDITKLKNVEEVQKDFVANVSHELRTPITSIKGYVETVLDSYEGKDKKVKQFLSIALKQADMLNAIIEDLLSLSRLEQNGSGHIELNTADIGQVIHQAISLCTEKAVEQKVEVRNLTGPGVSFRVNYRLLEQAVMNLLDNAVKFSAPGKQVDIKAEIIDDTLTISVVDHGCGIRSEEKDRIFERFYMVDKSRSKELGGTGLGLAIVKQIAALHQGTIEVESTLGEGSTFILKIPKSHDK